MKPFRPNVYALRKRNLFFLGLLHFFISVSGQNEDMIVPDSIYPGYIQDNHLVPFEEDTSLFHLTELRFQSEISKNEYINLDTFRHYGHLAIQQSKRLNYFQGLLRVFIGLGSGYVAKNEIDSSLYYSRLAILYAAALNDTSKLSQAYLNVGWALLFRNKAEESLESALHAYSLAKESNDTSMLIRVNTRLGKIYISLDQMFNEYKTYSESIELCKNSGDNNSLMHNYLWLANLFYTASMKNRHELIVKEALQYKDCITDTMALYKLNYLLVNWYDRNKQYDSMLYFSKKLIPLEKKLNRIPYSLGRIATVYRDKNQLDSAKYYLDWLMLELLNSGAYIDAITYLSLGSVEFELGNFPIAYAYFKKAKNQHTNSAFVRQQTYKAFYLYYDTFHQYLKAYAYLKDYANLTDSIVAAGNRYKEGIAVVDLESKKLGEQIDLLSKNNELQVALTSEQKQQKNMVYGSATILLILIGIGFVKYRKQKELKSTQELLYERLRISRELHDEIGATLSGIAMYSHVANDQLKHEKLEEAKSSLSYMQKSAGEMVNKLSDIVWLINPEQDTILEMMGRLGEYGKQMTEAKNMQMRIDVPSELTNIHIPLEARRNIYLIFKEGINNAVKYSNGRFVELHVKMEDTLLSFLVQDDGNGFDMVTMRQGNGLINMKKRAEQIGAIFQMESSPYSGTRIKVQYKLIQ